MFPSPRLLPFLDIDDTVINVEIDECCPHCGHSILELDPDEVDPKIHCGGCGKDTGYALYLLPKEPKVFFYVTGDVRYTPVENSFNYGLLTNRDGMAKSFYNGFPIKGKEDWRIIDQSLLLEHLRKGDLTKDVNQAYLVKREAVNTARGGNNSPALVTVDSEL